MQEFSAGNKNINKGDQSDECFLPAKNSQIFREEFSSTDEDKDIDWLFVTTVTMVNH